MHHLELLNMPKQDLHIIMVALHFLVKGYGIISQITFLSSFKNAQYMYLIGNHSFKIFWADNMLYWF